MAGVMVVTGAAYSPQKSTTNSTCFIAGTLIIAEKWYVPIQQIKAGDLVYSEDPETGEKALKKILEVYVKETEQLVNIDINEEIIITTPEHLFYVKGKNWINAGALVVGDLLVQKSGDTKSIDNISIEYLEEPVTVYNFQVKDFHTYYVSIDEILVHNVCKPTSPVKVNDNALKKVDVHAIKHEFVKKISRYDIFKDTANNSTIWLGNKAQNVWLETGYSLKELVGIFPK